MNTCYSTYMNEVVKWKREEVASGRQKYMYIYIQRD